MKTKGLNFMEAVKAMKEGQKITRKSFNGLLCFDEYNQTNRVVNINNTVKYPYALDLDDIEATNWKVVDDDWKISNTINSFPYKIKTIYGKHSSTTTESPPIEGFKVIDTIDAIQIKDVKKCRDLIIRDLKDIANPLDCHTKPHEYAIFRSTYDIINKRFGEL